MARKKLTTRLEITVGGGLSSPVLAGNRICLHTRQQENEIVSAIVSAGKLLFVLKDDAELVVMRPNPASFDVVRRCTVAESPTWAHPVIDGNRIFVKDAESLALWTVGGP